MSFIFEDNNLLNKLLKVADRIKLADEVRINPESLVGYEAATRLLYKLQSDLGDENAPKAGAPVGSESQLRPEDSKLMVANLRTLGDFINWISQNKITWDGKRIAWTPQERQANPGDPDISNSWSFSSMSFDRDDRRAFDRKVNTTEAYANKERLVNYLTYLRDSEDAKTKDVFRFMIGSLIGELNGYLRTKGEPAVDTSPKKEEDKRSILDPNLIIDVFPSVFDPEKPLENLNNHPFIGNKDEANWLQFKDIESSGAFSNWLRNRKVKINKDGAASEVMALDTGVDPCMSIHAIYKRAFELSNISKGDDSLIKNYTKGVAAYLAAIQEYGRAYIGADGKACAVTKPGSGTEPGKKEPGKEEPGKTVPAGYGGRGESRDTADQRTIDIINDVAGKFPLNSQSIVLADISAFCLALRQLNDSSWNSSITQVEDNIRRALSILSTTKPTSLRDGISLTTQWSRNSAGQYTVPFHKDFDIPGNFCHYMRYMEEIVDTTASLISSFRSKYRNILSDTQRSMANSQVGSGTSSSGSIYYYNKGSIAEYLRNANCM